MSKQNHCLLFKIFQLPINSDQKVVCLCEFMALLSPVFQDVDHQGQQVADEEDRDHTEEQRGQAHLPRLGPGTGVRYTARHNPVTW